VTLYAGPGDFYEAINTLLAGVAVDPVLATLDPDGRMWWQLLNSNWLLAYDVGEVCICPDVPVTQTITAPHRNTLSLESSGRQFPARIASAATDYRMSRLVRW
jgi:hypothetical protein